MISSIKKILSRYSIKYPRSLIYMLQASEYDVSDFLDWYKKTDNFNNIEKRKKLVKTSKSLGLLLIAWTMLIFIYAIGLYFLITTKGADRYLAIFIIIFAPYILPYLLSVKLFFLRLLVQKPVEYFLLKNTKKKLEKHKGIKIAVVGSYGKTTMREVLKTVLSAGKKVSAPPHSYNTPLGINKFVKNLKNDEDVLIFEFGEYYPGDIEKLSNIVKPNIGIITGINEAHLKKFKNIESTISTIFEISDFVEAKNLYINGESKLAKENAPKESTIYSKEGVGNWKLEESET
ncbi:MAG: Mur ligase family protein, partial [Candidatus Paceibacterota bacterium]